MSEGMLCRACMLAASFATGEEDCGEAEGGEEDELAALAELEAAASAKKNKKRGRGGASPASAKKAKAKAKA